MMINIIISRSSKTLFCLEFKSGSNGTNISELQHILKFKNLKETITIYIQTLKKNINIFCSLAPNQTCGNIKLRFSRGRRGMGGGVNRSTDRRIW